MGGCQANGKAAGTCSPLCVPTACQFGSVARMLRAWHGSYNHNSQRLQQAAPHLKCDGRPVAAQECAAAVVAAWAACALQRRQAQAGCILIMDEIHGVAPPPRHLALAQEEGVRAPAALGREREAGRGGGGRSSMAWRVAGCQARAGRPRGHSTAQAPALFLPFFPSLPLSLPSLPTCCHGTAPPAAPRSRRPPAPPPRQPAAGRCARCRPAGRWARSRRTLRAGAAGRAGRPSAGTVGGKTGIGKCSAGSGSCPPLIPCTLTLAPTLIPTQAAPT